MKKILLIIIIFIIPLTLSAQLKVALHSTGITTIFGGPNSFLDAYAASVNGDTIYLPGGNIPYPSTINKSLVIIGAGHYPDSTSVTDKTVLTGNLSISADADNLHLEGMEITGTVTFTSNNKVDYVVIKRCKMGVVTYEGTGMDANKCTNNEISESVITGNLTCSNLKSSMISNCLIGGRIFDGSELDINNNILFYNYSSWIPGNLTYIFTNIDNSFISNNIVFRTYTNEVLYGCDLSTFSNNIFTHTPDPGANTFVNNYFNVQVSPLFINQTGTTFDYSHDYHLVDPSIYSATDGTQVGIYGSMFPYKEGSVPMNPHFQVKSIAPVTDSDGELSIHFEVEAQENNEGLYSSILAYRYWINDDFENVKDVSLTTPDQKISLIANLNLSQIPRGDYTISFQFKDSNGLWSAVTTDSFEKLSLTIADFTYSTIKTCDSTKVSFANKSIDEDLYRWDIGDGSYDSIADPVHTYYTPGTYIVSLKVTDSFTMADSTKSDTLYISGNTSSVLNVVACDNYLSPSGRYEFNSTGTYLDTIPNHWECDSLLTINLTIKNSTYSTDVISACKNYTWIDGIRYTSDNNTATYKLTNSSGCDSIVTLDLKINVVDTSVVQNGLTLTSNSTAAIYQWLDCNNGGSVIAGESTQSFTASQNGRYAVEVTQNNCVDTSGCFSIVSIGILENTFARNIVVYPNPTDGLVIVSLGETLDEFTVIVTDTDGRIVNQLSYKHTEMFEILLEFNPGIYLMTIISEDKKANIRLVKN